ncbi:hypothetical protein [Anaerocolumna sp.]|uniref:hypothetical protein n=1 Tax=Anaerocolumna sp. TaxID=2041569 RepID=UPI0028B00DFA|nr:hypothetical protein [Anaerocolumna sp.]
MEETINFNLKKPASEDFYNVQDINDNMDIIDSEIKTAQDKADKAFQSASNGKEAIKAAITGVDPEVTIPNDATFQQLADAIGQIETGVNTDDATATAEKILAGMTAYVKGAKVAGTMINRSGATHMADNLYADTGYVILKPPIGYYDGVDGSSVRQNEPNLRSENIRGGVSIFGVAGNSNVVDTSDGVLDANLMVQGLRGYSKGSKYAGTMTNRLSGNDVLAEGYAVKGTSLYLRPPSRNAFNGGSVYKDEPNLISSNILSGKNIFGVVGSVIAGKRYATGIVTSSNTSTTFKNPGNVSYYKSYIILSQLNLTFTPSIILFVNNSSSFTFTNKSGYFGNDGGYCTVSLVESTALRHITYPDTYIASDIFSNQVTFYAYE